MRIGFFPNIDKENIAATLRQVVAACTEAGLSVYLPAEYVWAGQLKESCFPPGHVLPRSELLKTIDVAFSFGGDGTILQLSKELLPYDIAVCGVNLGELGFLNQIEIEDLTERITQLAQGDYLIEERLLLEGRIEGPRGTRTLPLALNEYVIMRKEPGKMARINLSINGTMTQQYPADGLILATATGSTGYSMSAGGPILAPENHSLIVTPICPHLLQSTPLLLTEQSLIGVTMPEREKALMVSVDGIFDAEILNDEQLIVQTHTRYSRFIRFPQQAFFTTLFRKLNGRREVERV